MCYTAYSIIPTTSMRETRLTHLGAIPGCSLPKAVLHHGCLFDRIHWHHLQVSKFRPSAAKGAIEHTLHFVGNAQLKYIQVVARGHKGCDDRRTCAVIAIAPLEMLEIACLHHPSSPMLKTAGSRLPLATRSCLGAFPWPQTCYFKGNGGTAPYTIPPSRGRSRLLNHH